MTCYSCFIYADIRISSRLGRGFPEACESGSADRASPASRVAQLVRTSILTVPTIARGSPRFFRFDQERSGDWLVSKGRLDAQDAPRLNRNGDVLRLQALYRFEWGVRRREPAFRWVDDYHEGAAIANTGYELQLTYVHVRPKVIVDANLL